MKENNECPLISVIVPVYNCEQYLDYCVRSIIEQDYSNIEIILVDDGSTDLSSNMCEEYAKEDTRITVIHKKNGGLSSARNAGLRVATGDFLVYIDSDDYVRRDYISLLYSVIAEDNTDMVACCARKVATDQDFTVNNEHDYEHYIYDHDTALLKMVGMQMPIYAHSKMYKTCLAKTATFPEGRLYEDISYNWQLIKNINRVSYITDDPYFYRQRKGSIVNQEFKHGRMDQLYFSEDIYIDVLKYGDQNLVSAAMARCLFTAFDNFSLITDNTSKDYKYLRDAIEKYGNGILGNSYCSKAMKFMYLLYKINPFLGQRVGKFYKNFNAFLRTI